MVRTVQNVFHVKQRQHKMSDEPIILQERFAESKLDLEFLKLFNEKGYLSIPVGQGFPTKAAREAMMRAMDSDWLALIDLVPHSEEEVMMRIYKLTPGGWERRRVLTATRQH